MTVGEVCNREVIITDRDVVLEVLAQEIDPVSICAEDLMSENLVCVKESDSTWEAINLMRNKALDECPL